MIEPGQVISADGFIGGIEIRRLIGEGSQGVVFEATFPTGEVSALKWYHEHTATPLQWESIADLVERGAPDPRFLWPETLVRSPDSSGFGYLMPLRPQSFASLVDLLTAKVDVPFTIVCRLCMELADCFLILHSQGLCYRDISFGNVFFDPETGVPMICDNDNVGIDGVGPVSVLGTRRFMAPEVVRREASPSTDTDLYSLAVLLFYILMTGHPLIGKRELEFDCWDETTESILFGSDPLFVFDPEDDRNVPSPSLHGSVSNYWGLYPRFMRALFIQAFTTGLTDPKNGRVRESVWRTALGRLRGCILRCEQCAKENFADPEGGPINCWFCGRSVSYPLWLRVGGNLVALGNSSRVLGHDLKQNRDMSTLVAEVTTHPQRAGLYGLTNCTADSWSAVLPSGENREIDPGRSIRLRSGTELSIGGVKTQIVENRI